MNIKQVIFDLEHRMNQFYLLGLYELSDQYFRAAQLILSMYSEQEYQ